MADEPAVHIGDLPVEVMLEVLARLPPADLAHGARSVCRAWRDLAEEPGAWSHRRLQVAPRKHRPLSLSDRRVLRRAAALRVLAVSLRRCRDLDTPLAALLPACTRLHELHLTLPRLDADLVRDVLGHWPRLRELRVEACRLQAGCLEQVSQLQQLQHLQLATLEPDVWPQLLQATTSALPELRSLHVDAPVQQQAQHGPADVVQALSDRLQRLRVGGLVPASLPLLSAIGQCSRLESLRLEDCGTLTDDGLLLLTGLRLHSLSLSSASSISSAALSRFLRVADLSLLRELNLSGCTALTNSVLRWLRCRPYPLKVIAEDCSNFSNPTLLSPTAATYCRAPGLITSNSAGHPTPQVPLRVV